VRGNRRGQGVWSFSRYAGHEAGAVAALFGAALIAGVLGLAPASAQTVVNQIDEDINPLINVSPAVIAVGPVTDSHNSATSQPNTGFTETAEVNQVFRIDNDILIDAITGVALVADIDNTDIDFSNDAGHSNSHTGTFSVDLVESANIDQLNELANAIAIANADSGVTAEINNETIAFFNHALINNTNDGTTSGSLMQSAEIAQTNRLANAISIVDSGGGASAAINNVGVSFLNDTTNGLRNLNLGIVGGALTQTGELKQVNVIVNKIETKGGSTGIDNAGAKLTNNGSGINNANAVDVGGNLTQTGKIKQANVVANSIDTKGGGDEINNAGANLANTSASIGNFNEVETSVGNLTQTGEIKQANIIASRIDTKGSAAIDNESASLTNNANISNRNLGDVIGGVTQSAKIAQANVVASSIAGYGGGSAAIDNAGANLGNASSVIVNSNSGTVGLDLEQSGKIKQANVIASSIDTKGGDAEIDNEGASLSNEAVDSIVNTNTDGVGNDLTQTGEIKQVNVIASRIDTGGSAGIDNENAALSNEANGDSLNSVLNVNEGSVGGDLMQSAEIWQSNLLAGSIDTKAGEAGIDNTGADLTNSATKGINNFNNGSVTGDLTQSGKLAQANTLASSIDTKDSVAGISNRGVILLNDAADGTLAGNGQSVGEDLTQTGDVRQANTIASSIAYRAGDAGIDNENAILSNNGDLILLSTNEGNVGGDLTQSKQMKEANTLLSSIEGSGDSAVIVNRGALHLNAAFGLGNTNAESVTGSVVQSGAMWQANTIASRIEAKAGSAAIDNGGVRLRNDGFDGVLNLNQASVGSNLTQEGEIKQANTIASLIDTKNGDARIDNTNAELSNDAMDGIVNTNSGTVGGDLTQSGEIAQANVIASRIAGDAEIDNETIEFGNLAQIANTNLEPVDGGVSQSGKIDQANILASRIDYGGGGAEIENKGIDFENKAEIVNHNDDRVTNGDLTQSAEIAQANVIASRIAGDAGIANENIRLSNGAGIENTVFESGSIGSLTQSGEVDQVNTVASSIVIDDSGIGAEIGNGGMVLINSASVEDNDSRTPIIGDLTQSAKLKQANTVANSIEGDAKIANERISLNNGGTEIGNENNQSPVGGSLAQSLEVVQANRVINSIAGGGDAEIDNKELALTNTATTGNASIANPVGGDLTQRAKVKQANIVASLIDTKGGQAKIDNEDLNFNSGELNDPIEIKNSNDGPIVGDLTQFAKIEQANVLASLITGSGNGAEIDNANIEFENVAITNNDNGDPVDDDLTQRAKIEQANSIANDIDYGGGGTRIGNQDISLFNGAAVSNVNSDNVGGALTQSGKIKQANILASSITGDAEIGNEVISVDNDIGSVLNQNSGNGIGSLTQSGEVAQANTIASLIDNGGWGAAIGNSDIILSNTAGSVLNQNTGNSIEGDLTQSGEIVKANTVTSSITGGKGAEIVNEGINLENIPGTVANLNLEGNIGGDLTQSGEVADANTIANRITGGKGAGIGNEQISLASQGSVTNSNSNGEVDGSLMQSGQIGQANTIASSIDSGGRWAEIDNLSISLNNDISSVINNNSGSPIGGNLTQSGTIKQANTIASSIDGDAKIGNEGVALFNAATVNNGNLNSGIGGSLTQSGDIAQANTVASSIAIGSGGGGAEIGNTAFSLTNAAEINNSNAQGGNNGLSQSAKVKQANTLASSISGDAEIGNEDLTLINSAVIANNNLNGASAGATQSGEIGQANTIASLIDHGGGWAEIGYIDLDITNDARIENDNTTSAVAGTLAQSAEIDQANLMASSIVIDGDGAGIGNADVNMDNVANVANSNVMSAVGDLMQSAAVTQANSVASSIRGDAEIENTQITLTNIADVGNDNNQSGTGTGLAQSAEIAQANTVASSIILGGGGTAEIVNEATNLSNSTRVGNSNDLNGVASIGTSLAQSADIDQANVIASSIDHSGGGSAAIGNVALGLINNANINNQNETQSAIGTDLTQSGKIKQANTVANSIDGGDEIANVDIGLTNQANMSNGNNVSEVDGNLAQSGEIDQANTIASSIAEGEGGAEIDNEGIALRNSASIGNDNDSSGVGGALTQSGKIRQANTIASRIEADAKIGNTGLNLNNNANINNRDSESGVGDNLAQSGDIDQANLVASAIDGEGDRAKIGNEGLNLSNNAAAINVNDLSGIGGDLTQGTKLHQANTVASSVKLGNSRTASGGKAGVLAKIDNENLALQNNTSAVRNDNLDSGVGGDLTQSIEVGQANTVASEVDIANSGTASGGKAGVLAKIDNKSLVLQNSARVDNQNTGGIGDDLTQDIKVDQSNTVASSIDVANSGTAEGGKVGILAKIDNKDLTLQNTTTAANTNTGGVGGDLTQTVDINQTNLVASSIRIDNSGTAKGGEVGIVAKIDSENVVLQNTASGGTSTTQTSTETSDIEIVNSGSAHGGALGIYAAHQGESTRIFNSGKISAGSNFAIDTVGASTWLYNQSGGVILGYVDLTDNADSFMNEAGSTFQARMTSDFRGGDDLFDNHGLVQTAGDETAAEFTSFVNLETFNNAGTISLVDGMEGDIFRISNTFGGTDLDFNASSGSTLAVDAFLGGPGSIADNFIIDGDVTGLTTLQVNNTAPGMGAYNPGGIPVVFVNGDVSANAFDLPQPVDAGLFDYDLFYEAGPVDQFELRSFPGAGAHVLPQLVTAAQDIFHTTNETWLDRTADLRALLGANGAGVANLKDGGSGYNSITPGVWVKGSATWLDQDGKASSSAYGRSYDYNLGRDLNIGNVEAGVDFGSRNVWAEGDALIFGVLGGAIFAELDYNALARRFEVDGGEVGAYATYLNGGLYVDNLLKVNFVEFDPSAGSGLPGSLDSTTWGFRTDGGYRFGTVGQGVFIEPQATIAVAWSEIDNFTLAGNRVSFSDETDVRGRLGLRAGISRTLSNGALVEPFVIGSVWGDFSDDNSAAVTSLGTPFGPFTDDGDDVWGVLSAGINGFAQSGRISGFGKVDVIVGDETDGVSAKGGVRYNW